MSDIATALNSLTQLGEIKTHTQIEGIWTKSSKTFTLHGNKFEIIVDEDSKVYETAEDGGNILKEMHFKVEPIGDYEPLEADILANIEYERKEREAIAERGGWNMPFWNSQRPSCYDQGGTHVPQGIMHQKFHPRGPVLEGMFMHEFKIYSLEVWDTPDGQALNIRGTTEEGKRDAIRASLARKEARQAASAKI